MSKDTGEKPTDEERLVALLHCYYHMDFYSPLNSQYRKNVRVIEYMIEELGGEHD